MTTAAAAGQRLKPRYGSRQKVYLPKFVISLVRTDQLPPTFARFNVPLSFNKLDLKDYLHNVYKIQAYNIRTHVYPSKVVRATEPGFKRAYRRRQAKKSMTIEMTKPFLWPEVPKNLDLWDKENYDSVQNQQRDRREKELALDIPSIKNIPGRKTIAEQAKELLEGKTKWEPTWKQLKGVDFAPPGMQHLQRWRRESKPKQ